MYHIPDDLRAKRSADKLFNGLVWCLKDNRIENISVSEIVGVSGVGRATFYRLFDNPSDIILYKCNRLIYDEIEKLEKPVSFRSILITQLEVFMENSLLLKILVENKLDDTLYTVGNKNYTLFKNAILNGKDVSDEFIDYIIRIMFFSTLAVLKVWDTGGRKENANELFDKVNSSIMTFAKLLGTK